MLLSTACIIAIIGFFVLVQNETVKEKKFLCTHCDYKATKNGHLKTHIKSVHEGKKFPCQHCEYKATFKVSLQTHIKSVHEAMRTGLLQKHTNLNGKIRAVAVSGVLDVYLMLM